MNYLIVCPRFVTNKDDFYYFPLGIGYISASLKMVRDTVLNLNLNNIEKDDTYDTLKEYITNKKIDCVAIGGTSLLYNQIREIIDYTEEINPEIITIIGGGLVTASPETAMEGIKNADIGIIGEGEYTIREIADAIENGTDYGLVDGIIFRNQKGELIRTKFRGDIEDLDALPFPDLEGFGYSKMLNLTNVSKGVVNYIENAIPICSSRSCPYNCTFCFHTSGKKYRKRSLDNIFAEIDYRILQYKVKYFYFLDELFISNEQRVVEFCNRIKKYNIKWYCTFRADSLSVDLFKIMKEAGCSFAGIGIESADNDILNGMNKHITIEKIENTFINTRKAKIGLFGNFLLGDKNETFETFSKTLKWYNEHPQYNLNFFKIIVLPGSELYKYAVLNGYIKDELKYWEDGFPYINLTKMSDEEYCECEKLMEESLIERTYEPRSVKVLDLNTTKKYLSLEIECRDCGNKYIVQESDFSGLNKHTCDKCSQFHNVTVYSLFKDKIDDQIKKRNKFVAIWGLGYYFKRFFKVSTCQYGDKFYLIDRNKNKQKEGLFGKKVYSPEIIKEMNIDTVLIGADLQNHIHSIRNDLKEYSSVKTIKTFNDFIFELLEDK